MNSYKTLPSPVVTLSDVPSLPVTLSALVTALGKVKIPVDVGATVKSNTILPNAPAGKLVKLKVVSAVIVAVW
jgi:hypothetical protein